MLLEGHSFCLNKSFERYISEWKLRLGTFELEKGATSIRYFHQKIRYFLLPPRNQDVSCIEFIIKNSVLELSVKIRDKFLDIYKSTFKIKRTRVVDSACDYSLQTWKRHGYIRKYQSTVIREYASTDWLCRAKKRFSLANACEPGPTLVGRPCCRPRRVEPHLWGEGILCNKSRSKISIQLYWELQNPSVTI